MMVNPNGVCRKCKEAEYRGRRERELLDEIRAYVGEHGHVPACRDMANPGEGRHLFGTWAAAVRAAGFEPLKPGDSKCPPRLGYPDRIAITGAGGVKGWAKVDPGDYERLVSHRWQMGSDRYAYGRPHGRGTPRIAMHRFILGMDSSDPLDVDHINGERLDNRRSNLRRCTRAENLSNRTVPSTGESRFRGVHRARGARSWTARASRNNRTVHIGSFPTELDAAIAAQEWRDAHMPLAQPDPALVEALGSWPSTGAAA